MRKYLNLIAYIGRQKLPITCGWYYGCVIRSYPKVDEPLSSPYNMINQTPGGPTC